MRCSEFERIMLTTRASERTEAECETLAVHSAHCPPCAELAEKALQMESLLGGVEPVATSEKGMEASRSCCRTGCSRPQSAREPVTVQIRIRDSSWRQAWCRC